MFFEGKGYVYVGCERIITRDNKSVRIAKFFDEDDFEMFEMFVPDDKFVLPKEKTKVNVIIKPTRWNGRTSFRLVGVEEM